MFQGVDVEQDLQRLVLEVDRDDRIESAWMTADPAIKMLSKKIPSKDSEPHAGAPSGAMGGDVLGTSPIFEPPQYSIVSGIDERLGKIWASSPPPNAHGPRGGGGVKTLAELEEELGVEKKSAEDGLRSQHQLPSPAQLHARMGSGMDRSVSPLAHQMLLQQQQQQQLSAAAALLQQQQSVRVSASRLW